MTATTRHPPRSRRPLLGVRRRPGRLALLLMRAPRPLYHHGLGRLLGNTFLLITHVGRRTGRQRETVAMALRYDPISRETVVCSAWGPETEWIRNLRANPAVRIDIGRDSYEPEQRFLSQDEATAVVTEFRLRHPRRVRLLAAVLGWGELEGAGAVRAFVRDRPFVSFRPAAGR